MSTQDKEMLKRCREVYGTVYIETRVVTEKPEDEWESIVDWQLSRLKPHLLMRLKEVKEARRP